MVNQEISLKTTDLGKIEKRCMKGLNKTQLLFFAVCFAFDPVQLS